MASFRITCKMLWCFLKYADIEILIIGLVTKRGTKGKMGVMAVKYFHDWFWMKLQELSCNCFIDLKFSLQQRFQIEGRK